ncbi:hypothetical protein G7K_0967-t1 [Saitoella complicata NRRL Y-17804]|uniref:GH16 domain-containing protein n=2 Tax=Saitoella complicata (strain BCRC 22490 / CBS 7301 / JCM 7358 / NBRC 10748 / NRRL Y-17804) TaxID=698492 RepID=A0A0E9NBG7_SAICN|nr:hypothetical protein G7K_0967-t1 [Saitoella complicata NRRL Y-17804]
MPQSDKSRQSHNSSPPSKSGVRRPPALNIPGHRSRRGGPGDTEEEQPSISFTNANGEAYSVIGSEEGSISSSKGSAARKHKSTKQWAEDVERELPSPVIEESRNGSVSTASGQSMLSPMQQSFPSPERRHSTIGGVSLPVSPTTPERKQSLTAQTLASLPSAMKNYSRPNSALEVNDEKTEELPDSPRKNATARPGMAERQGSVAFDVPAGEKKGLAYINEEEISPPRSSLGSFSDRRSSTSSYRRPIFQSRRLTAPVEKPWLLKKRTMRERWVSAFPLIGLVIGIIGSAFITWRGVSILPNKNLCLVFEDNFQGDTINSTIWSHEVQVGGFGNHQFEWATADSSESFVANGSLYIIPQLTETVVQPADITDGYTLNLTSLGQCTSTNSSDCVITSNSTLGTILNPVRSAFLTTKNTHSIRYGRVEIRAKMPVGDWIWPRIWMLPKDNVYGDWPASGEIDILESRGNDITYTGNGRNWMTSTLHWGPSSSYDRYWKTRNVRMTEQTTLSADYHKIGFEWTDKYMYMWLDNRIRQVMFIDTSANAKTFWNRGDFPERDSDTQELLVNPWTEGTHSAPFDQDFYLNINVAVGGTNGWFPDDVGDKPWVNTAPSVAMRDFWNKKDVWYNTWPNSTARGMAIDSVKMYKKCSAYTTD